MNKNRKGFSVIEGLLVVLLLAAISFGGYWVWHSHKSTAKNQNAQSSQTKSSIETMSLVSAPMVSVKYDSSWTRLKEFTYDRDGLFKTIDGVKFLVSFTLTPFKYDYMDRSAGGGYPAGELYKTITANGKSYYIGKVTDSGVEEAFLSTCPPTPNGSCSLFLTYSDGSTGYMIVDLHRFVPTSSNYKATSPLVLSNPADKKAIDEFAAIMGTIKY